MSLESLGPNLISVYNSRKEMALESLGPNLIPVQPSNPCGSHTAYELSPKWCLPLGNTLIRVVLIPMLPQRNAW